MQKLAFWDLQFYKYLPQKYCCPCMNYNYSKTHLPAVSLVVSVTDCSSGVSVLRECLSLYVYLHLMLKTGC